MFTIPDKGEGVADVQSLLFQDELERAVNDPWLGTFVKSGLAVTAQGSPNMTVIVAAGVVYSGGVRFPHSGSGSLAISAADTLLPRIDTVVVNAAGALAVRVGTPFAYSTAAGTTPKPPNLTAGDVPLAQIYVPNAATTIPSVQITDRRVFVPNLSNFPLEVGLVDNVCHILPTHSATAPDVRGIGAVTTGGTITHTTPSAGRINQLWRQRFANVVTTANQFLGYWMNSSTLKQFWRGNAAGQGGFYFRGKMVIGLWPAATVRFFMGLHSNGAAAVISDNLAGNACGLWHTTTDAATVLNFATRDNTTNNFTPITLATAMAAGQGYELIMYCAPNSSTLYYKVVDMLTGNTLADSSTSTNLPLNTAFLGPEMGMSNGTANITVTTVAPDIVECYIASPAIRT